MTPVSPQTSSDNQSDNQKSFNICWPVQILKLIVKKHCPMLQTHCETLPEFGAFGVYPVNITATYKRENHSTFAQGYWAKWVVMG